MTADEKWMIHVILEANTQPLDTDTIAVTLVSLHKRGLDEYVRRYAHHAVSSG